MKNQSKTSILVEGALMIAMTTVLSFIKFFTLPQGGSITLEMLPLICMGYRHGVKWGVFTGFVHGVLQMFLGFANVLYCTTLAAQVGCILLDYLVAFSVLGLAGGLARLLGDNLPALGAGTVIACLLRFVCSFLSGMLIWGGYAPEGTPVWLYSFTYNASYMLPNAILTAVVMVALAKTVPAVFSRQQVAHPA